MWWVEKEMLVYIYIYVHIYIEIYWSSNVSIKLLYCFIVGTIFFIPANVRSSKLASSTYMLSNLVSSTGPFVANPTYSQLWYLVFQVPGAIHESLVSETFRICWNVHLDKAGWKVPFFRYSFTKMLQGVWTLVEAIHKNAKMLGATTWNLEKNMEN